MIIDAHGHVSAPAELWAYKATLLAARGSHGRGGLKFTDDQIRHAVEKVPFGPHSHMDYLNKIGTNVQAISPRPFQLMHSEKPAKIVQWFQEEVNNVIYRQTQLYPDRFFGVCGLPQPAGEPLDMAIKELTRCVKELGFKGCLLNPDPYENSGTMAPPMGDRYWYPLYEKLCELDVPAHIHGTGSHAVEREPYTLHFINEETTAVFGLVNSAVFDDFPDLKIICSHGGGAMPYQVGRFTAGTIMHAGRGEAFDKAKLFSEKMKKLYYDTVLYTREANELLIKVVGPDRCLFGAECPGTGSVVHPVDKRHMDDVAPLISGIEWLSATDKQKILSDNAVKLFKLEAMVKAKTA
jgi:predicted TIM-barrel fold metal-dependent hydrolase